MTDPHAKFNDRSSIITALRCESAATPDAYTADLMSQAADMIDQMPPAPEKPQPPAKIDLTNVVAFFDQIDNMTQALTPIVDKNELEQVQRDYDEMDVCIILSAAYYHHQRTYYPDDCDLSTINSQPFG